MDAVKIIECPRDAWQGLKKVIPTEEKAAYIKALWEAGFQHIDAVSFVSPKAVPQMADSELVMEALGNVIAGPTAPEIIGIAVNDVGLERAMLTPGVTTIGYPYSVSAQFRRQNANMDRGESRALVEKMRVASHVAGQDFVVYISMAFGNHYGEPWSIELVVEAVQWLRALQVRCISLADTVGTSTPESVREIYRAVRPHADGVELGVHLHSRAEGAAEKVLAAYEEGCRRFDCSLTGLGGCPFAGDELVGNIPTEIVVETFESRGISTGLDSAKLRPLKESTREIAARYNVQSFVL